MRVELLCPCGAKMQAECAGNDPFQRESVERMSAAWTSEHRNHIAQEAPHADFTTPPAAAQDTADDDDSFLADAAPTLLGLLSRKSVQAAVDEATDADGWVRFVDGQVVSRNALLNKLVALDSDAARAAGGE